MQSLDAQKLLKEDKQRTESGLPFRFGKEFNVDYSLKDGIWEIQDTAVVWSLTISSPGAYSLNFVFEELHLIQGAELYVFNPNGSMVYGPVTSEQNSLDATFLTDLIAGDEVIIKLIEPLNTKDKSSLKISRVVHGYVNLLSSLTELGRGSSLSCNNDINCFPNWTNESNAVALVLLSSGSELCSGAFVNNTSQDYRPFFLSAFHCIDSDQNGAISDTERNNAQNWAFRFQYKTTTCNGSIVTNYITYNRANFRAAWKDTDFVLMELINRIDDDRLSFLGWDRTGNIPTTDTSIHHPAGDVMKISFDNHSLAANSSSINWNGGLISPSNTHWVVGFDNGTTEGGSSGSPLFNDNRQVIGQLHGGNSGCAPVTKYYGQFHRSWIGGGTNNTRLSNWLDPNNTGTTTINTIRLPSISGPSGIICENTEVTYTLSNILPNATIRWESSPTLSLISGQGAPTARFRTQSIDNISWLTAVGATVNNSGLILGPSTWVGVPKIREDYSQNYPGTVYTPHIMGTESDSYFIFDYPGSYYVSQYYYYPQQLMTIADIRFSLVSPGHYITEACNHCGFGVKQEWIGSSGYYTYPNPTSGMLTLKKEESNFKNQMTNAVNLTNESLLLRFYTSPLGMLSKELKVDLKEETTVNVSDLPDGNYVLSIIKNGKIIDSKNIILKK